MLRSLPIMSDLDIRPAALSDLPAVVAMLADDPLGAQRESPDDLAPYRTAFHRLADDPNQHLVVAVREARVVGTLQLTVVPGLSRKGATRSIIEGVRIHADERGSGLGTQLIQWAVDESRRQGCRLVQLTSDATRTDAHRFYERLGFTASHVGFKLSL
ncbi:L-amino acid N-acyltransferase YncA [Streptomyces sp. DvalAA-21]|nr:GCN5-related N-acetyltransferase [Streptomyces sp. SirexAA-E]PZX41487.1 L-amino acid N-acyltransferase YncA [Streptomyces sp. DvalAA-21]RAJ37884.1 L-amino acid N-acyltransferase YncA [Streptomyces sp. DpondAA-E10]RAJ51732.1 L-amino acid N-acyltransferase YncA [Streptomyces sp. DpondAA-A50]SCD26769.1 L-amino acid N-acyltransferase YncA [Streptomyces sp. DpondAA-F4a]SCD42498.1 L-amino acid N-acyltransferase YncA [Streptomyces sp. BpilaLS-43]SCL90817.1 L-amino acid N-acyltransferase YncA [Str